MAFDQTTRNRLNRFVADARKLLANEFTRQLQAIYGMNPMSGAVANLNSLAGLTPNQQETAQLLRDTFEHYLAANDHSTGKSKEKENRLAALDRIVREQAFTVLNRLAALRMSEARGFLTESLANGYDSKGFQLFHRIAGTSLGETGDAYTHYLFSIFDEFALDLSVLFDRFAAQGRLFPSTPVLLDLLALINNDQVAPLWAEDETIGWIYQYFNSQEERKKMRDASQTPRNSRELAVRNQFFTPRYVVEFLTDNTLGRIWYEMTKGQTKLVDECKYLVKRPNEVLLTEGEQVPEQEQIEGLSQEELLQQTVFIEHRALKDPRNIKMLDPACGSMHFGLYCFDLFERIYDEAWDIEASQGPDVFLRENNQASLTQSYIDKAEYLIHVPRLIIEHNIHGVDIDPRAAQVAGMSLWQRAHNSWQQASLKPQHRPQITRSNIVCAEPMPGEKELLQEFASQLKPTVLGQLVEVIFEKMQLAGEAGTLLKIEKEIEDAIAGAKAIWQQQNKAISQFPDLAKVAKQRGDVDFDVSDIDDEGFWHQAEQKILDALLQYASSISADMTEQKRLFASDAAKGFAFIDLCKKRFDVVLMNPPFGASTMNSEDTSFSSPAACKNLFSAFVLRGEEFTSEVNGKIGVISDRSFVLKESYQEYRKWLYIDKSLENFIDLGWGVLDANVEVACYTIGKTQNKSTFLRLNDIDVNQHQEKILSTIEQFNNSSKSFLLLDFNNFKKLPNNSFSYWLPQSLLMDFEIDESIGENVAKTARGMSSGKVEFACRLVWEVPLGAEDDKTIWNPVNVGGGKAPLFRSPFMLFRHQQDWGAMKYFPGFSLKNTDLYWRKAIGWGKRTDLLSAQLLPMSMITAEDGQILVPYNEADIWTALGFLNSSYAQAAINSICGGHKGPGYVSKIPFINKLKDSAVGVLAEAGVRYQIELSVCDETSMYFISPFFYGSEPSVILEKYNETVSNINMTLRTIDAEVFSVLNRTEKEKAEIEGLLPNLLVLENHWAVNESDLIKKLISYAFGFVFNRWKKVENQNDASENFDLLVLPKHPPALNHLSNIDSSMFFVDDAEHDKDIVKEFIVKFRALYSDEVSADNMLEQFCISKMIPEIRNYLNLPKHFFAEHLELYSRSRRAAPIYWPLQIDSSSVIVWVYAHSVSNQTLLIINNNFIQLKIESVEKEIEKLIQNKLRNVQEEKRLNFLTEQLSKLQSLSIEFIRISKFWQPNLNDGVQITAAPLWRLFQHTAWQKKLKQTWEKLKDGEYDWAHLAFSTWPERVLKKCHSDRSLAIAHDVENDLWHEVEVTKKNKKEPVWEWQPKPFSDTELHAYIKVNIATDERLKLYRSNQANNVNGGKL
jgi:hypothetical protein